MLLITTNLNAFGADTSTRDAGFVNKYMISTDENSFEVTFTTNFLISSHNFSASDNTLQFHVETGLAEDNIGELIIPLTLIDGEFIVLLDDEEIPIQVNKTSKSSIITIIFDGEGKHTLDIITLDESNGGGCLIATAAFGSEIAPQVQLLREIRDGKVMTTNYGSVFMNGFNQFYYSFSPVVADYERENPAFKEAVKLTLTPLLASLTLLQHADIDSEYDIMGYGIGIILLNIGMYFAVPASLIMIFRKRVNMEKLDIKYV